MPTHECAHVCEEFALELVGFDNSAGCARRRDAGAVDTHRDEHVLACG
jgi:hypothetical protein